jgi:hypothetical protein
LTSAPLKLNSMKALNGVGIVIAVLLGIILLIPKPSDGSAPGLADVQHYFTFAIPLPVLMILAYKRLRLDLAEQRLRITKGIWPFVAKVDVKLDDAAVIQVEAMNGQRWTSYTAQLVLQDQDKPILLFADGDEDQLRTIINFAGNAGLRLIAGQNLTEIGPDWARAALREHSCP